MRIKPLEKALKAAEADYADCKAKLEALVGVPSYAEGGRDLAIVSVRIEALATKVISASAIVAAQRLATIDHTHLDDYGARLERVADNSQRLITLLDSIVMRLDAQGGPKPLFPH